MDLEFSAFSHSGTQMDGAAVGGDDFPHDGKSHTSTVFLMGDEWTEDLFLLFRRDAAAIVFYGDHQPFVVGEYLEGDAPALGDGFHGVFDQIEKRLF